MIILRLLRNNNDGSAMFSGTSQLLYGLVCHTGLRGFHPDEILQIRSIENNFTTGAVKVRHPDFYHGQTVGLS